MSDLFARIIDFIRNQAPRGSEVIGLDTPLVTSGLLDSVMLVRLAALVERETGLIIPDRDVTAEHFDTIRLIETYIAARGFDA